MERCDEDKTILKMEEYVDLRKTSARSHQKPGITGLTVTLRTPQSGKEKLQFPPLKCSKYTWIGHPSMQKRRK